MPAAVAEGLTGVTVDRDVAPLVIGDENQHGSFVDRFAEQCSLEVQIGAATPQLAIVLAGRKLEHAVSPRRRDPAG
jgi:hypothetical protein